MKDGQSQEVQLRLFETQLVWRELPHQVREQITQLLGILCIEIIEKQELPQEQYDE